MTTGMIRRTLAVAILCIAVLGTAVLLASCAEEEKDSFNYEQPIAALRGALNYGDEQGYLGCWLPQKKMMFESSEAYTEGFLQNVYNKDDFSGRIQLKIMEDEPLDDEELDGLEEEIRSEFGMHLDFTKGRQLSVRFSAQGEDSMLSEIRELTVVRYENTWYIYDDVIDSLSLVPVDIK